MPDPCEQTLPAGTKWPRDSRSLPTLSKDLVLARWEFLQLSKALGTDHAFFIDVLDELERLGWTVKYAGKEVQ